MYHITTTHSYFNIKNMKHLIRNILTEETEDFRIINSSNEYVSNIFKFLSRMFPHIPVDVLSEEISNVNHNISLIAISHNNIVGCLLLSEESLCEYIETTEIIRIDTSPNVNDLCDMRPLKGVVFAIHPKFRGTTLNIRLVKMVLSITKNYDYVYGLVYSFLKTHNYWKRMGMSNYATVIDDGEVVEIYLNK